MSSVTSLEDTIARADYWLAQEREDDYSLEGSVTYDLVRDLTAALRAAGVVPPEPASHDHDAWLSHLIDEWGHLGTVMKVFATLTDDQALRLLDAARARCELTPESLGATVAAVRGGAPAP